MSKEKSLYELVRIINEAIIISILNKQEHALEPDKKKPLCHAEHPDPDRRKGDTGR